MKFGLEFCKKCFKLLDMHMCVPSLVLRLGTLVALPLVISISVAKTSKTGFLVTVVLLVSFPDPTPCKGKGLLTLEYFFVVFTQQSCDAIRWTDSRKFCA